MTAPYRFLTDIVAALDGASRYELADTLRDRPGDPVLLHLVGDDDDGDAHDYAPGFCHRLLQTGVPRNGGPCPCKEAQ